MTDLRSVLVLKKNNFYLKTAAVKYSCGFFDPKEVSVTDQYITVKGEASGEYSEKHSRFLGFIVPCKTESQASKVIEQKRKEYWDARHIVYAYLLRDGSARFSDDGEPHGTAGKPVLEVLKSSGVKDAVVIVVRYFGGILLGTGGLVRAYTAAADNALKNCERVIVSVADSFFVSVGYGDYDKLNFVLKNIGAEIISTDFADSVGVKFSVRRDKTEICLKRISDTFSACVSPKFEEKTEIYEKV